MKDPFARAFIAGRSDADIAALNEQLLAEAQALGLLFECLDCEHWDPALEKCSMDYPFADLLDVRGLRPGVPATGVVLLATGQTAFCKHFEAL